MAGENERKKAGWALGVRREEEKSKEMGGVTSEFYGENINIRNIIGLFKVPAIHSTS